MMRCPNPRHGNNPPFLECEYMRENKEKWKCPKCKAVFVIPLDLV